MADIWGDGNILPPVSLLAGMDGAEAAVPVYTMLAGADGTVATVPAYTISASGSFLDFLAGSLPIYALEGLVTSEGDATVVAGLPAYTIESAGVTGELLDGGELNLAGHTLVADFGWFAQNELPVHTLSGLVAAGAILVGDVVLPVYTLAATFAATNSFSAENDLPVYVISASGITGGVGTAALLIPAYQLAAQGFSGAAMSATNELPAYVLVGAGFSTYTLTGDNTLPAYQLDAALSSAIAVAYRTWVLNLRKRVLTEYTNFNFNSFASCWGRLFAAGASGIFEIGAEDTDAGTAIDAVIRTGKHKFGTTFASRVPRIYVGASAAGALEFRTITGADGRRGYLLPWNQTSEVQLRRVPVGRGPKSTYWQFEVLNREGADFTLDVIQPYPEGHVRRVI